MLYDCGITSSDPDQDRRFHAVYGLRPTSITPELKRELCILVQTPGIPIEWLYFLFGWSHASRRAIKDWSAAVDYSAEAKINVDSIQDGDGWRMLKAMRQAHKFVGAVPLAASLALRMDPRQGKDIAEELGVKPYRVWDWTKKQVFHPLTGERLMPRVGG